MKAIPAYKNSLSGILIFNKLDEEFFLTRCENLKVSLLRQKRSRSEIH